MIRVEPQTSFNVVWEQKQHRSQTTIKCILNKENGKAKLLSVVCTQGNIIPLNGVREALSKATNELQRPLPNDTA